MEKSRNALDIRECAANSCLAVSPRFILHRTDQQPAPATSSIDSLHQDIDVPAPDICKPQAIACGNISGAGEHLPEAGNPIKAIAGRQRGAGNPATLHSPAPGEAGDDALCWYPMRVTYNRQLRVKENLDRLGVENFLPMREHTERRNGRIRHSRRPAISNLIFVRSTMERITKLKHTDPVAALMRYMTRRPVDRPDAPAEILTVPEREMDNFIKATSGPESEYTYLRPDELRGHEHGRVLICSGPFAGVEGTIKRIHGTRHVVIELNGIGGVCINFIPRSSMIEI
jgi:transcription antitermination factor NusG